MDCVRLRESGDKDVEEGRGENRALGDASTGVHGGGDSVLITAGSRPAPEIAGQPPDRVVREGGSVKKGEELGVVHRVKCLGKVN